MKGENLWTAPLRDYRKADSTVYLILMDFAKERMTL